MEEMISIPKEKLLKTYKEDFDKFYHDRFDKTTVTSSAARMNLLEELFGEELFENIT